MMDKKSHFAQQTFINFSLCGSFQHYEFNMNAFDGSSLSHKLKSVMKFKFSSELSPKTIYSGNQGPEPGHYSLRVLVILHPELSGREEDGQPASLWREVTGKTTNPLLHSKEFPKCRCL